MRCILLVDHDGLVNTILREGLGLHEVVGRDVDAVSCFKSGGDYASLSCPWVDIIEDVEEVNWSVHLSESFIYTSINLLPENG